MNYLLENMGFKATCLIYGATLLNSCVAGALFQPVEWHMKVNKNIKLELSSLKTDFELPNENNKINKNKMNRKIFKNPSFSSDIYASHSSLSIASVNIKNTSSRISLEHENINDESKSNTKYRQLTSTISELKALLSLTIKYLTILKQFRAIIFAAGMSFFCCGYINTLMTLPFALQSKGFTREESAWAISAGSISSMVLRLVTPALSDNPKFDKRIFYMLGTLIAAVSTSGKLIFKTCNKFCLTP